MERILIATDDGRNASPALRWAADLAERYEAQLLAVRVVAPESLVGGGDAAAAGPELAELVSQVAGPRGLSRVLFESDAAAAILRLAADERVDVLVVDNAGMSGRHEFLLGSLANRVSHNATCTVVIVNEDGEGRVAVSAAPTTDGALPPEGALLKRAARIGQVMAGLAVGELRGRATDGEGRDRTRARRFRDGLEKLGPTFAKLGQILSTRPDLLPEAYIAELATLQDRVTPLTEAEVVAVMERELAVPWEDVFHAIEPEPLAAGSIAQVHRAVLAGGERVVLKVQRPSAAGDIERDLRLLEMFTAKAAQDPAFSQVVDLPAIIDQLAGSLRKELDFRNEAANVARMAEVLAPFSRLAVPAVYNEISTGRLLVMSEIRGVPVLETPPGPERKEAARQLLESFYQQVLEGGFFHADPHPGNLLWADGTIYFLDLGMAGELDPELRETLLLLLLAFYHEDADFLTELLVGISDAVPAGLDMEALRGDVAELVAGFRRLSLRELRLGPLLQRMTAISLRHGLRLPASLALVGKAFGQMQLATAELDPELDPFSVAGSFVLRRFRGRLRGWLSPQALFYEGEKLKARIGRLVASVEELTGARPGRNLQVDFHGMEALEEVALRATRRVTLALLAAGLVIGGGVAAASGRVATWAVGVLAASAAVLVVALLADLYRPRR